MPIATNAAARLRAFAAQARCPSSPVISTRGLLFANLDTSHNSGFVPKITIGLIDVEETRQQLRAAREVNHLARPALGQHPCGAPVALDAVNEETVDES